ncbi:Ubox domain containing protein [Acanthamoeba castellanii str. Neff]|uniref:Ubox domain containing protein n=1 Tax=Acanthamoeba castellanii (strain ATCC 30010 / Neff) TaxID=1257118 RepID=L8H139_ACACF|nr:Ubox domain containing protein [Acanthamoeba castellanii str. Neff]ELR18937.1 Ubox domain containing protein [Acanthamoeba castellanii str. Neff]
MERISSFYSLEHLVTTLDEQGVPEEYICPITQDFMRDPCIAEDGHTYERAAIEEWLGRHGTSPITRDYISAERLMPDATLRKMIDDFLGEKRQLLLSQREREKGSRLSSADPETDGRSAPPPQFLAANQAAPRGDDDDDGDEGDDDDGDDDSGHPYYASGGAKAERAPLMGLSAERGAMKREQQQARSKQMWSAHHPRPTKASRSPHREDITPASAHGVVSRQVSTSTSTTSSCWMCVLY